MFRKKRKSGFTLVELLAVVLIIGILISVAINVFSSSTEKAEATVCAANTRSLKGMLTVSHLSGENVQETFDANVKSFLCPSGGVISYTYSRESAEYFVKCSIHNGVSAFDKIFQMYDGTYTGAIHSQSKDEEGSKANALYSSLNAEQKAFLDQYVWNITTTNHGTRFFFTTTNHGTRFFFTTPALFDAAGTAGAEVYFYKYDPLTGKFQVSADRSNRGVNNSQAVVTGNSSNWGAYDSEGNYIRNGWMDALPADLTNPAGK